MHCKVITGLFLLVSCVFQATPAEHSTSSSPSKPQGGSAWWLLGTAAATGSCYWLYNRFQHKESLPKPLTPEERADQAELVLKTCLQSSGEGSVDRNGIPLACRGVALDFALACEALGAQNPRTKIRNALDFSQPYQ